MFDLGGTLHIQTAAPFKSSGQPTTLFFALMSPGLHGGGPPAQHSIALWINAILCMWTGIKASGVPALQGEQACAGHTV